MKNDKYGERRGTAFGLAGVVKGFRISCLKKYEIVITLREAFDDRISEKRREGVLLAFECLCENLGILFEPYVIQMLPLLLVSFSDLVIAIREAAVRAAHAMISQLSSQGVKLVLPSLLEGENPNYEEKSPKTDNGIPISLRNQSFEEKNLSPESEIPDSLTERTEPTMKVYERRNKGKEKQGESVLIQIVQPSSSPSPVRQSDSKVENAPEVTLEPSTLSNDLSSENHTDSDLSLSTRRYPSREHRPPIRFGFSPKRPPTDSKALYLLLITPQLTDYLKPLKLLHINYPLYLFLVNCRMH
ncbi:hypothetical protein LWI29_031779 [Acer saccharum]|uniref:Uncharacterized protein n=1 Tax=Acer saccharum TaxID=4024 RepID=A0AA39T6U6_ACESA|nr:hypothetical protein LWI29_031779 [Acer saccharum]